MQSVYDPVISGDNHGANVMPLAVLQNITTTACSRPVRDHSTKYTALSTSFSILANILIISRLAFNRFFGVRAFTLDDWVVLALLPITHATLLLHLQVPLPCRQHR